MARKPGIDSTFGGYDTLGRIRRLREEDERKQAQRQQEYERRLREYSQFQEEQNRGIADWIKSTSPTALEEERQKLRIAQRPQYEAQQNRNISEYIKSLSPMEMEQEEQQRRIEAKKREDAAAAVRKGANALTPELEAQYQLYNGGRQRQTEESGPNRLTPQVEFMYEYTSRRNNRDRQKDVDIAPKPPEQRLTPDVEAQRQRVARGEAPSTALTPYAQYMQDYQARREKDARETGENAESGWRDVGRTAYGMAANFESNVGQPLINLAKGVEGFGDMLYRNTGSELFKPDAPGTRLSDILTESDEFAADARKMREKVGPLGQQLIDAAGAAGNMLSSFAFYGNLANSMGSPVNATARLANMGGGKIGSALGRAGARAGIEILSNPGNFGISLGSGLSSFSDSYANGANFAQALTNGILKGMTEYYSNKLFSGTPFEDTEDKGYVTKLIERAAEDLGGSEVLQAINASTGGKVMSWIFDKTGEGMEEVVTGIMDPMIDRITYDRTKDLATVDELTEEFLGGVLLSLLMSGGEAMINGLQSEKKMTEREAKERLVRMGIDPRTAQEYAGDIAEAVTAMLKDEQIRTEDYREKSVGDPEIAARAAEGNDESLQRYAAIYNRADSARDLRRGANPAQVEQSAFLTDNEAKNFFYIWSKQGARAADAFYDQYLAPTLEQRRNAAAQDYFQRKVRDRQAAAPGEEGYFNNPPEDIEQALGVLAGELDDAQDVKEGTRQADTPPTPPAPQRAPESTTPGNPNVRAEERTAEPTTAQENAQQESEVSAPPVPRAQETASEAPTEGKLRIPEQKQQEQTETIAPVEERQGPPAPKAAQRTEMTRGTDAKAQRAAQQALATQRKRALADNSPQSLQEMGFRTAGEGTTHVFAESQWDAEMKALAEGLRADGIEPTFFTGNAMNAEGKKVATLLEENKLAIQADSRSKTIQTLAEQALGHGITAATSTASSADTQTQAAAETPTATVSAETGRETATKEAGAPKLRIKRQEGARAQATRASGEAAGASQADIDTAARLAQVLNRDIRFYNEPVQNGTRINGYTENGVIYINAGVKAKPAVWVVAHELTHNTENAKAYQGLLKLAKQYYGDQWTKKRDRRVENAKQIASARNDDSFLLDPEEAERELTADYVAQRLLTDEDTIREVVKYDAPTARRILSYLKNLLAKMKGEEPNLEWAIDRYSTALKQAAKEAQTKGDGKKYSFAGQKAVEADTRSLAEAEMMERFKEDPETIRQKTGWFRGDDGMWRFEIDDSGMEYSRRGDAEYLNDPEYREYQDLWDKVVVQMNASEEEIARMRELDQKYKGVVPLMQYKLINGGAKVKDIINHKALFRNYPQIANTGVEFAELEQGTNGQYNKVRGVIELSNELRDAPEDTLIHEIQHVIQAIEGFASGASTEYWRKNPKIKADAKEKVQAAKDRVAKVEDKFRKEWPNDEINLNLARQYVELSEQYFEDDSADLLDTMQRLNEIENEAKEAGFSDLLDEYDEARGLLSLAESEAKHKIVDPNKLYIRTAGEIEARDAASRRNMTQEQRLRIRPNVGSEGVVFVERDNGYQASKKERNSIKNQIQFSAEKDTAEQAQEAMEERTLGGRRLLDTPALKKLGVKVNGSVGRYANTQQLLAKNKAAKELKKQAQDAEKRLQATDAEIDFASGIAAGVYDEEDIPSRLRKDVVMELADYYFASDSANLDTLIRVRADINRGLLLKAEDLMDELDIKPQSMILLNERTPERNLRSMFGERGKEIAEWLIQPVRENESEKIRWFNKQMDRVREFTDSKGQKRELTREESALTMKVMEGRAAAEMVADLETNPKNRYGKQQAKNIRDAAENIRKGGSAADAAKEFSLGDRERDLAEKYASWQNALEELKQADSTIVENAAKEYARIFDEFYEAINDFLAAHGYEPIGYIKGYAPHMQPEENQNLLEKAFGAMGINTQVTELPANIAGQTANYKPNKRWNPYFLQRTGSTAQYDIVKAYESYVDYLSDIFYHTDDIMRARQLVRWIRKSYAKDEIKSQLDYIETIREAPIEVKQTLLRDAGEIGQTSVLSPMDVEEKMQEYVEKLFSRVTDSTQYSNLVMWLENYANILAGKQSFADRGWEYSTGRKSLNFANRLNAAFQKANVAGNLSSAINQTAQVPMIAAELGERDFLSAVFDVVTGKVQQGNFLQDSDFLMEKEGKDYLYADRADKFINALFTPASVADHLVSTVAVRGAFNKAIRQGKSYAEAMRYADDFGRKLMGSRAKGSRPLAYESKGFFSKMIHQFQVECANSWDHIATDLPSEFKEIAKTQGKNKAARALAAVLVRAILGTFILNRLTDELYGGTPAPFDILGLTANFIASGQGLTTNNWIRKVIDNGMEKVTGQRIFGTKETETDFSLKDASEELIYNVMNDLPLARNVAAVLGLGDESLPLPGASGEFSAMKKAVDGMLKDGVDKGDIEALLRATFQAASQFVPGGRQIRKIAEGAEAVIKGGNYKNGKLQYPVEGFGDTARALVFGKNATQAAREYWAAGGKELSDKQTGIYEGLLDEGMSRREAYDTITGYKEEGTLDDFVKWQDSRSKTAGIDEETFIQFRQDTAGLEADKIDGKTVSGSLKEKVKNYIDGLENLTADQKTAMLLDYNKTYSLKDVVWSNGPAEAPAPTAAPTQEPAATPMPTATPETETPGLTYRGQQYYDGFVAAGIREDAADTLARKLENNETSGHEQWRAVYNAASYSDREKAVTSVMNDGAKRNWELAKNAGCSLDDYISVRENYLDLDENGKQKQSEWNATLDQYTFSTDEAKDLRIKGTLWQILTGSESTKNNPYDKDAGRQVIDAKSGGGSGSGSYAPARIPTLRIPAAPKVEKPKSGLRITARPQQEATRPSGLRITARAK